MTTTTEISAGQRDTGNAASFIVLKVEFAKLVVAALWAAQDRPLALSALESLAYHALRGFAGGRPADAFSQGARLMLAGLDGNGSARGRVDEHVVICRAHMSSAIHGDPVDVFRLASLGGGREAHGCIATCRIPHVSVSESGLLTQT